MRTAQRRPIRRLGQETQAHIAAGEVITRPVSALKELVENAIDAGASRVVVTVRRSLADEFSVTDDGHGLSAADLPLAFEPHATSKLRELADLDALETLGFRGEALPSIARISRLEITSRAEEEDEGSRLEVEGGSLSEVRVTGRPVGTTVTVRDLFYNVPARRKFQRSAAGELRAAARLLSAYALGYPEIEFRFQVDDRERLVAPATDSLAERVASVLGRRFLEQCLEVREERPGVHLHAFVGVPELARATREGQVLLLNRRWIVSPLLSQAMRHAYGNLLPPSRHPVGVLDLRLDPASVDCNVHPTKSEVHLAHEDLVFPFVSRAIAAPLEKLAPRYEPRGAAAPERPPSLEELTRGRTPQMGLFVPGRIPELPRPQGHVEGEAEAVVRERPSLWLQPPASREGSGEAGAEAAAGADLPSPAEAGVRFANLWQLHETYILAPITNGLLIVDQHAAHERILYEEALDRLGRQGSTSQQLLFARVVDLTRAEFDLVVELVDPLSRLGFDLAPISPPTVVLRGAPPALGDRDPGQLLQDILDGVADERGGQLPEDELTDRLAKSFACHAAVRAGQRLTLEEMNALIDRLFATSLPHGDPHGRPSYVRVDLNELHSRFGRSGPTP
ncbi:MAG: DNA mismatch repair endonuclease MutL [Thermoanaerobaculia bacterium]|nr:DNA mismatch repair endonuclease MutL [Thermoanaerobaculia bacterium]